MKLHGERGSYVTRSSVKKGDRVTGQEELGIPEGSEVTSSKKLSTVGIAVSFTKGLPNYSSLKVEVMCHLPSVAGDEADTYEKAREFAVSRVRKELKKVMKQLKQDME